MGYLQGRKNMPSKLKVLKEDRLFYYKIFCIVYFLNIFTSLEKKASIPNKLQG